MFCEASQCMNVALPGLTMSIAVSTRLRAARR